MCGAGAQRALVGPGPGWVCRRGRAFPWSLEEPGWAWPWLGLRQLFQTRPPQAGPEPSPGEDVTNPLDPALLPVPQSLPVHGSWVSPGSCRCRVGSLFMLLAPGFVLQVTQDVPAVGDRGHSSRWGPPLFSLLSTLLTPR